MDIRMRLYLFLKCLWNCAGVICKKREAPVRIISSNVLIKTSDLSNGRDWVIRVILEYKMFLHDAIGIGLFFWMLITLQKPRPRTKRTYLDPTSLSRASKCSLSCEKDVISPIAALLKNDKAKSWSLATANAKPPQGSISLALSQLMFVLMFQPTRRKTKGCKRSAVQDGGS